MPQGIAALGREKSEVPDALGADVRRGDVPMLERRVAIEPVQALHRRAVDQRVVGERIAQDRRRDAIEARARALLREEVVRMQAPAAPLPADVQWHVAHHAQALARGIYEDTQ